MKNITFLKSSVMVIPVIKYMMDCISAVFVCWFQISRFSFCVCFYVSRLTDGVPRSLSL